LDALVAFGALAALGAFATFGAASSAEAFGLRPLGFGSAITSATSSITTSASTGAVAFDFAFAGFFSEILIPFRRP